MKIGNVELPGYAALAPMAGVADRAFREMCKSLGAGYMVGEMASAKGLTMSDKKTAELLEVTDFERPMAVQLFGDEPLTMAKAAELAMRYKPDIIDINMGCPAPKIVNNGGGSSLMKNPALAGEIIKEVALAVPVPVTVKIRKGYDDSSVNAVEIAKIAEQNGAAAVCVHGRTRAQMYSPPVDLDIIKAVKQSISVPVIANGDITDVYSAKAMYDNTGADYIMVGRGALGAPWIFDNINSYLYNGLEPKQPHLQYRVEVMLKHIALMCKYKGEYTAMREARKHTSWYTKGMPEAAKLRVMLSKIEQYKDLELIAEYILSRERR